MYRGLAGGERITHDSQTIEPAYGRSASALRTGVRVEDVPRKDVTVMDDKENGLVRRDL